MSVLWQVGYATAVILGIVYILVPKRIHGFGFEFFGVHRPASLRTLASLSGFIEA
jgi:hypothetical protein